jgi:hypothetical protein
MAKQKFQVGDEVQIVLKRKPFIPHTGLVIKVVKDGPRITYRVRDKEEYIYYSWELIKITKEHKLYEKITGKYYFEDHGYVHPQDEANHSTRGPHFNPKDISIT